MEDDTSKNRRNNWFRKELERHILDVIEMD